MDTIEIDTSKINSLCEDLYDALCAKGKMGEAAMVIEDETRRLSAAICRIVPPQTKTIGERAITNDVKSFFAAADEELIDTIGSQHGLTNIDTWITGRDGVPTHLRWDRIDPTGARMGELANAVRNSKGKLPKGHELSTATDWRARVVVTKEARAAYAAKMISHLGRWKASWAQVVKDMGNATIADWINGHFPTPKGVSDISGLMDGEFPMVKFGSRAPNVTRQLNEIRDAARIRCEAMKKRIELIVSDWNRDKARGMRIQARAKRSGNGGAYVIS